MNSPTNHRVRIGLLIALVLAALAVVAVSLFAQARGTSENPSNGSSAGGARSAPPDASARLRSAVTVPGLMEHERRFQAIADANGGNRAAGTPGYDDSAAYVARELREAGYEVTLQTFELPFFEELQPARLKRGEQGTGGYTRGKDFALMEYSGSGEITASVRPVDAGPDSLTSGCEAQDFVGFPDGEIALMRRGHCTFRRKAGNAEKAGASAALIFNDGGRGHTGVLRGTLGDPGVEIPVLGTTSEVGEAFLDAARRRGDAETHLSARTVSRTRETSNVIAESPGGDEGRTVVVGAHLDSVPEGPGINDNGSGSATVLEIALQMSRLGIEPRSRVRFAFWGAEELGLLGSKHYVDRLSEDEASDISAYLNFDMVGSPNFVRNVYEGPDATEEVFTDYFASRGIEVEVNSALNGRSDHGPFAAEGIPTGGLFSGAEGIKTRGEAASFGGDAGAAHDPCYHRACDDLDNLDEEALDQFSDAAAHATVTLANNPPR